MSSVRGSDGAQVVDAYGCGRPARWLPRTLAAAVLVGALLVALRVDPQEQVSGSRSFRMALILAAAVVSLWIVKRGGELRLYVRLTDSAVVFESGSARQDLKLDDIEALGYEAPFGASRTWLPAAVLIDRRGTSWRVSGLLHRGDRLIEAIVRRAGRDDLRSWADALRVVERMRRAGARVRAGYAVAAVVLAVAAAYYLH